MDDTLLNLDETPTAPDRKQGSAIARFFLVRPTTLVSVASVLGLVGIWAVLSLGHVVSNRFLASPLEVAREIGVLFKEGYINVPFHVHLGYSITRSLAGLVAAIPVGIPLGLLIGYNRIVSAVLLPPFAMFRPVPPIALIPLAVLWFGIGEFAKVFLIFLAAFLYITLSVAHGVKEVRETLIRAARSLGANDRQLFFHVIFPETLPHIMNAIKVGTAISWAVVVAAELVAAQKGLGYMIMDAATFFRIADVYVGIVFIGVVGFLLEQLIIICENRFVHWSGK